MARRSILSQLFQQSAGYVIRLRLSFLFSVVINDAIKSFAIKSSETCGIVRFELDVLAK